VAQNSPNVIAQHLSPSAPTTSHPRKAIRQFAVPDLKVQQLTNRSRANFQRILYSQGSSPPHPTTQHKTDSTTRVLRQQSRNGLGNRIEVVPPIYPHNRHKKNKIHAKRKRQLHRPGELRRSPGASAMVGGKARGGWRLRVSR